MSTINIKENLVANFPVFKIKEDILCYLENHFKDFLVKNTFNLPINDINDASISRNVTFSERDKITVLIFLIEYDLHFGFYYKITIGVGNITFHKNRPCEAEKCFIYLKYNEDISLYDCEFYTT